MTSCTPLYNTVLWGRSHPPSPVTQPGFLTRWTLTKELGLQVPAGVHLVGQKSWLDRVPFTALSQPSSRRMSCVCTRNDAGAHNAPILSKPNHITHPLLAISEIKATAFIIYMRNELGFPTNFIFMRCLFHIPPLFLYCCQHEPSPQVVISRQTAYRPTPLNGQCVILWRNTTHAWDDVTLCCLCAWQRSACDVRLLPDKTRRSQHSTKCEIISSPVGAEGRTEQ